MTKTQFWTQGDDAVNHGVEVRQLDAQITASRSLPQPSVASGMAADVIELDTADHGVELDASSTPQISTSSSRL
jgi:hypothetical protein